MIAEQSTHQLRPKQTWNIHYRHCVPISMFTVRDHSQEFHHQLALADAKLKKFHISDIPILNMKNRSSYVGGGQTCTFVHHSFCKFKRERNENVFGEVRFLLAFVDPSKNSGDALCIPMSSLSRVLFLLCSFHFFANGRVTKGQATPFPTMRVLCNDLRLTRAHAVSKAGALVGA